MHDVIRVKDKYYILSSSSLADDRTRVLKSGETFAVFDRRGDVEPAGGVQGVYSEETRYLSQWVLRLSRERPLLLSSAVKDDNALLAVDLTNPDMRVNGELVPRGTVHIERSKFLWNATHYEQLRIFNYSLLPVQLSLSIQFASDYADIFEVRGMQRAQRGSRLKESIDAEGVTLSYRGLDGRIRRTRIHCSPKPQRISASEMLLPASIPSKGEVTYTFTVSCQSGEQNGQPSSFDVAAQEAARAPQLARERAPHIYAANEQFNDWLNRSFADLQMMITETPCGRYPYAGVPWFSTVFGRDGVITAMETLWINPEIARGVLCYLAGTQAKEVIPEADAEPGKILHEMRKGEMAALKEVPFERYYGSVDATPLFVMLAGDYYRRTADLAFLRELWPHVEAALGWIDRYGDADGDGFVEYNRRSNKGLVHQGWKDSSDSVFHRDGTLAEGPIALCEVQGYVYAAKRRAAELAVALGQPRLAEELEDQARSIRERFEQAFWCEDLATYALALDGNKQPCRVRASNAGHCLFTGIASQEHARLLAKTLLQPDFFTGWGVRTVSAAEPRYNAMSYHNGSVWPHDNALIARGLAAYGLKKEVLKILTGLFDASVFIDLHRLPELFCGFTRRPGEGPTLYPVACSPQAWAAGTVFLTLESCLGISVQASPPVIHFRRSLLPESLPRIRISNLQVGSANVDLAIQRAGESFNVTVLQKHGEIDIVAVK